MNSFTDNFTDEEWSFFTSKGEVDQQKIMEHFNTGKSFHDSVLTVAQESLVSYYEWVKNNVTDEDKYKVDDWDNHHQTNYEGENLTEYEKQLFDKLPNVGKWQVGNYSRMWRALEEAEECLMEFVYHELDYLNNPL